MIYQSYVHYFCRLVKMFRQPIILCTRSHTAGRMVVTKRHSNSKASLKIQRTSTAVDTNPPELILMRSITLEA